MHQICGVVLAGGKSRRMGSDKALLSFDGSIFLEKIVRSMQGVFAERLVVGRSAASGVSMLSSDVPFFKDVRKDCGPLGGMYTALLLCKSPAALFVCCDTPLMDRQVYETVCAAADPEGRRLILIATGPGRWGNFPILVPKTYIQKIRRLLDVGEHSIKSLVQEAVTTPVFLQEEEKEKIHSINTPQDYEALLRKRRALVA